MLQFQLGGFAALAFTVLTAFQFNLPELRAEHGCGEPATTRCCPTCKTSKSQHCKHGCRAEYPPQAILVQSMPVALAPTALLAPGAALNAAQFTTSQNDLFNRAFAQALKNVQAAQKPAESQVAQQSPTDCCEDLDVRLKRLEQRMESLESNVTQFLQNQKTTLDQLDKIESKLKTN